MATQGGRMKHPHYEMMRLSEFIEAKVNNERGAVLLISACLTSFEQVSAEG